MANPEHVEIVRAGTDAIREWRSLHPDVPMDLAEADLEGTILDGAYLSGVDLSRARLAGASLERAQLDQANLEGANLEEARLEGARLTSVSLAGARLEGADLDEADLEFADLHNAKMRGASLNNAELFEANLSGACLIDAECFRADLYDADLSAANLSGADLSGADLSYANLIAADFSMAKLPLAVLKAASIRETIFNDSYWDRTVLSDLDLSEAIGLETVNHLGPSTIGIDTIIASKGQIPEVFLRGAGVPQQFIDYIPSLLGSMEPIQFYSCFISYSSHDDAFARRLHSRMRDENIRVWFAPEDMKGGRKSYDQIDQAIRLHDKLLLVLSKESMASEWVITEIRKARKREIREGRQMLFPIGLVDFGTIKEWECFDTDTGRDLAREVREYHIPDFSDWKNQDSFEKGFERLLEDLSLDLDAKRD